ncbi:MAG TPA: pilus assembly protein PilB [Phycisphaerales bacterium]|nr:pilus assembly protein PilB [Phycisphaerales bacterium]
MPPVDPAELKQRKIGRVLTKLGKVSREVVHEALEVQKNRKVLLGQLLVEMGHITQKDVQEALAGQAGMAFLDLTGIEIPPEVAAALPAETALAYQVVPIEFDPKTRRIKIALKSAKNFRAVDDLKLLMGFRVEAVVAEEAQVDAKLQKHYAGQQSSVGELVTELASDTKLSNLASKSPAVGAGGGAASIDLDSVLEASEDNKVIKLLNLVLLQAIKDKASDIHFEPFEDEFKMRYRIDGVLYEMVPPPKHLGPAITSRIKVMSNLDIAERRLPQDGRVELQVGGRPVDLRVAVLPTMHGESVVMRVLDRSNVELSLDRIGLSPDYLRLVRTIIERPNGIVVVTGPTGSGKTTTLYAALNELNDIETKILTAEDPVEYDIDGLCQCQMNAEAGLTFARALRSFLRQDPDVILVGEVRDLETAQIAVQASLTGHLVFTTLHTNDAPSSVVRLLDLGLESFLLTATIEAIVAQRLVRTICARCREEFTPTEEQLMELDLRPEAIRGKRFFRGRGCDVCHNSGYKGRTAVFEIMVMDDGLRDLIMKEASVAVLREEARRRGMKTLRESGLAAIYEGLTTIDEVVRETFSDE